MNSATPPAKPGEQQRYVPQRKLRSVGSYYTIYEALQTNLDRVVELRVLNHKLSEGSAEYKRFALECKTLASLDHPNLLKVLDIGIALDHVFYVTDLRVAQSLQALMDGGREFTARETVSIGVSLASALNHMHSRKILHRNLSTTTVMVLEETGTPYIAEFSLVKNQNLADLSAVGVPQVVESLFTPESTEGKELDERTDLFLLGRLLFKVLTHRFTVGRVLAAKTDAAGVEQQRHPKFFDPSIPDEVDAVVHRCLAVDPGNRHACAKDLMQALEMAWEKASVRMALARMRDSVQDTNMAGALGKQQESVARSGEVRRTVLQKSLESSSGDLGLSATDLNRNTLRLKRPTVKQAPTEGLLARYRALLGAVAVTLLVTGSLAWVVMDRVAAQEMEAERQRQEEAATMRSKTRVIEIPPMGDKVKKETGVVKAIPTTLINFQDRWYLLDNWIVQVAAAKRPLPFQRGDLVDVRKAYYVDQGGAAKKLDALYRKVDDWFVDHPQ